MIITVIGTPDSGKSLLAEEQIVSRSEPDDRYYIAAMIPYGTYGEEKVRKHRAMREDKGFQTIEQPFDVDKVLEVIPAPEEKALLLECVSNVVANEMFERGQKNKEQLKQKVLTDIRHLGRKAGTLVIVTNRFHLEAEYDEETRCYIEIMDEINKELLQLADEVIDTDPFKTI